LHTIQQFVDILASFFLKTKSKLAKKKQQGIVKQVNRKLYVQNRAVFDRKKQKQNFTLH